MFTLFSYIILLVVATDLEKEVGVDIPAEPYGEKSVGLHEYAVHEEVAAEVKEEAAVGKGIIYHPLYEDYCEWFRSKTDLLNYEVVLGEASNKEECISLYSEKKGTCDWHEVYTLTLKDNGECVCTEGMFQGDVPNINGNGDSISLILEDCDIGAITEILGEQKQCSFSGTIWDGKTKVQGLAECALNVASKITDCPSMKIMSSPSYPQWGCRCCKETSDEGDWRYHGLWNVYSVDANEAAVGLTNTESSAEASVQAYKVQGSGIIVYGFALIGLFSIAYFTTLQCSRKLPLQNQFDQIDEI